MLENMGLKVICEDCRSRSTVRRQDEPVWIHDFAMRTTDGAADRPRAASRQRFQDGFLPGLGRRDRG